MLTDADLFSFVRNPRAIMPGLVGRRHPQGDMKYMHQHLLVLWTVAKFLPAKTIVELGTADGASTMPLLKAAAENDGVLHSVDATSCPVAAAAVDYYRLSQWWRFHMMSTAAFASVCPQSIDLLFIDADHSYDAVKHDFETFAPRVRKGGLILMHDYLLADPPGVSRFIEELKPFAGQEYEIAVLPYCCGLVVVRKP